MSRRSTAATTARTTASRATRTSSRPRERRVRERRRLRQPAEAMKKMGATKVAALAYGTRLVHRGTPRSSEVAVPARACKAVYTNTTVDFGSTDVGPQVLGIKNAGADAVYLPLVASSNVAVVQGLAQNGVKMKSTVLATGYGQPLLDRRSRRPSAQSQSWQARTRRSSSRRRPPSSSRPTSRSTPATPACPTTASTPATSPATWPSSGLQNAGKNPPRDTFVDNMREVGPTTRRRPHVRRARRQPRELRQVQRPPSCGSGTSRSRTASSCVFPTRGKSVQGKLVGAADLLKANSEGALSATTTTPPTTAAP